MESKTLLEKYAQLDPAAQDQLLAFWDLLLARAEQSPSTMDETYREQIGNVGIWSEEDVEALEEAAARWQWDVPTW